MANCSLSNPNLKGNNDQKAASANGKVNQSVESIKMQMRVSEEEKQYRAKFGRDELKKYIKYFKCTKCGVRFKNNNNQNKKISFHPLLDVLMCASCCNYYGNGEFSLDSEGEDKYCRWCGEGGTLYSCSKCICAFCNKCIKKHFYESGLKKVEDDDDWVCYICNPKPLWYLRKICSMAKEINESKENGDEEKEEDDCKETTSNLKRKSASCEKINDYSMNSSDNSKSNSSNINERSNKKKLKRSFRVPVIDDESSSSENKKENQARKIRLRRLRKNSNTSSSDAESEKSKKHFKLDKKLITPSAPKNEINQETGVEKNKVILFEKLKGIWKMIQLLNEVGLKWSKEKVEFLLEPNNLKSLEDLKKEYKNLKSVSLMLCSSINQVHDSVEKLQLDLNCENLNDESHILQKEEDNLKNLIKALEEEMAQNSFSVKKKFEKNQITERISVGTSQITEQQSQSLFSDFSDSEGKTKVKKRKDELKNNFIEISKPLLKVKDFAKMNSENVFKTVNSNDEKEINEENSKNEKKNTDEKKDKSISDEYDAETEDSEEDVIIGNQKGKENYKENILNNEKNNDEKITRTLKNKSDLENKFGNFREKRKQYLKNITRNKNSENNDFKDGKDGNSPNKSNSTESTGQSDDDQRECSSSEEAIKTFNRRQGKRKKILESDEEIESSITNIESEKLDESDHESKKTGSKSSSSSSDSSSSTESKKFKKNTWKKTRIKKSKKKVIEKSDSEIESEDEEVKSDVKTKKKGRRNIKKILKKDFLKVTTKQALKLEEDRRKRIEERNQKLKEIFEENKEENEKNLEEKNTNGEEKVKDLILDFDDDTKEPLISVHKKLVKKLKPHQMDGVKFMWDNCFESVKRSEEEIGSGCILAHYMGLGKTFQVVTFVHTIMSHNLGVNTVLIICPLSIVNNWLVEFKTWLKDIKTHPIPLYEFGKNKTGYGRSLVLKKWQSNGGVLVVSYDLFRTLTNRTGKTYSSYLLDPGPDLVVCDEGHLLKNEDTVLSRCVNQIKTARRIVLTGTPLQNNLMEYHCMVQFVKPNLLGTKKEFLNRFVNPINNGQFEDSTEEDVKMMKKRSHVLHSLLSGCVQRCDYSVLTPYLPEKQEYVISLSLTEAQTQAYRYFVENLSNTITKGSKTASLFNDYHTLQKIWTHPRILFMQEEKESQKSSKIKDSRDSMDDFIVYSDEENSSTSKSDSEMSVEEISNENKGFESSLPDCDSENRTKAMEDLQENDLKLNWWKKFFKKSDCDDIRASNKLLVLFFLLKSFEKANDKVLVFSQSLKSLDLIEHFLNKIDDCTSDDENEGLINFKNNWVCGLDYFRLDGSTNSDLRSAWCKSFNKQSNSRARLFLISTKAGGLGINLCSANRVIVFDASWNPSHDLQSIFRVFRFGQKKTCYVYRFLAEATMEEKIYKRQVTKLSLSHRVVDEYQIERHYSMMNVKELYNFTPTPKEERKTPKLPKDKILADLLLTYKNEVVTYHEHDSLLENQEEQELTEEERKIAWQEFEQEKEQKAPVLNLFASCDQFNDGAVLPFVNAEILNAMTNIPVEVIERGLKIGLVPSPGEKSDSFISRIINRELFIGRIYEEL